ncbi:MAG: hypothetical protein O2783_04075 [Chloroflexi bacterium]|nr:hypothetical protein [Chloroflexota bacterium]
MRPTTVFLALLLLLAACAQSQPTAISTATTPPTPTATVTSTTALTPTTQAGATPAPTSTQPIPSALSPIFEQILTRVSEIRGLDPLEEIMPMFMTREELANALREDLDESREDIENGQNLLRIMGLIPQSADLYELLLSLYGEQVVGFYDTETEELYVIKGMAELTPLDEITLAHEYVHALQQQHFDIHTMTEAAEDDSEAGSALSALIEGDATVVQVEYMRTHLTSEQQQEIFSAGGDSPIFNASPYVLQESLLFPYSQGSVLVNTLLLFQAWEGVNDAYRNPPLSTEQVLHSAKYLAGERPVAVSLPDVAATLGQGWEMVCEDVMGEFLIKTYLSTRTSTNQAARAAAGWGGDRFNLMAGPRGEQALVALLEWDSERDAREFFDALNSSNSVPDEGFLGLNGDRVLWVFSPSNAITYEIVSLFPGF